MAMPCFRHLVLNYSALNIHVLCVQNTASNGERFTLVSDSLADLTTAHIVLNLG